MLVPDLEVTDRRLLLFHLAGNATFEKGEEFIDHCHPIIEELTPRAVFIFSCSTSRYSIKACARPPIVQSSVRT